MKKRESKNKNNLLKRIYFFECKRCAKCCSSENILVTLTHKDLQRLYEHFGSIEKLLEYIAFYQPENEKHYYLLKEKMKVPAFKTLRGLAYIGLLKKPNSSECIFLKGNSCLIYPIRPRACANYPLAFSVDKKGILKVGVAGSTKVLKTSCKGLLHPTSKRTYFKKDVEKTGIDTEKELKRLDYLAKIWNEMVDKGAVVPTVRNLLLFLLEEDNNSFLVRAAVDAKI